VAVHTLRHSYCRNSHCPDQRGGVFFKMT
jgi:hypothetical protein